MREQPSYAREDFEVLRRLCEAAEFTPCLWMLNRVARLWLDAADAVRFAVRAPDDYVSAHTQFFDRIEGRDATGAVATMSDYLARHDAQADRRARLCRGGRRVTWEPRTSRAVLRSLVPVICPPEAISLGDAIIDHMALTIGAGPALLGHGLAVALAAYDAGALPRYLRRARALTGARAEAYFAAWEHGLPPQQQFAKGVNQLMSPVLLRDARDDGRRAATGPRAVIDEVSRKRAVRVRRRRARAGGRDPRARSAADRA